MRELIINSAITHSLLLVLPLLGALLLRWERCPGWSILGGALAGMLLGPTILGRVAPDAFEKHFVGGVEQREARDSILRRQQADRLAAMKAGTAADALAEMDLVHQQQRRDAEAVVADARWSFQRPFRSYAAATITLTLLGAGLLRVSRRGRGEGLVAPISIGGWSAALPGGLAVGAMVGFWGHPVAGSFMAASAVAIGPWVLPDVDREAADQAERGGAHRVQAAGRVASILAIVAAAWAIGSQRGLEGVVWWTCLLSLPLGWLLPALSRRASAASAGAGGAWTSARIVEEVLRCALVPTVAACVAVRIELIEHFAFWPLLVFVVLSGDGRWIGAFIGAMLPGGRRWLRTMRLVMGSVACGPTQLAVTALAVHTWALPETIPLGLLVGAILIEMTTPMRRSVAWRLAEAEEELDRLEGEE